MMTLQAHSDAVPPMGPHGARHAQAYDTCSGTRPGPPAPGPDGEWALFLDVDGTLLDFAQEPGDVSVPAQLLDDVHRIHDRLQGAVALLSGRPLLQLDRLFAWHMRAAAGLHGDALRPPDARELACGDDGAMTRIRKQAASLAAAVPGIRLEDKQRALALHYRGAPAARARAERIAAALLRQPGRNTRCNAATWS